MANITITIPDNYVQDVLDAFAYIYRYQEMIEDPDGVPGPPDGEIPKIPNPESKAAFAKRMNANYIKEIYVTWKTKIDGENAKAAVRQQAQEDIDAVN